MISVVIPVYLNSANIEALLEALDGLYRRLSGEMEAVFVVDGSPDDSYLQLAARLPSCGFSSKLLLLSRNFGSFAAIRAGMRVAAGEEIAVLAADLQEPPELIVKFHERLSSGDFDIAIGRRSSRNDPLLTSLSSRIFWALYRKFVMPAVPPGGVDVFACRKEVATVILAFAERNTSLLGLLFWVGFRRAEVEYERLPRRAGRSAWTFSKKVQYLSDSVFSFSDLPIKLLLRVGVLGMILSFAIALIVIVARFAGGVAVPGYTPTVVILSFFGGLNCFGLGILGAYIWRTFENSKQRPNFIVLSEVTHQGRGVVNG